MASEQPIAHPYHGDLSEPVARLTIDPRVLLHPAVIQWATAAVALVAVALWPTERGGRLALVVGLAVAVGGAAGTLAALRRLRTFPFGVVVGLAMLVVGAVVAVVRPGGRGMARLIAAVLVLQALWLLWRTRTLPARRSAMLPLLLVISAVLTWYFPTEMLALISALLALAAAGGAFVLIGRLSALPPEERVRTSSLALFDRWFAERPKPASARSDVYDKVLFEGADFGRRLSRFFTLMGFAAVIASLGVLADSTAVVIGAMLVAPLMTPLMGIAVSLSMGWPRRMGRTTLVAAAGAVWAIMIGVLCGKLLANYLDIATNSQIQSRISPTMIDLLIALAAGAAGAYGLSRPDVSDALPGVAVAIALVPPLTVVGICWSQGAWSDGNGALLLFLTNALSIIVIGALTFVLTGQTSMREAAVGRRRVRTELFAIAVLGAVIVVGLALNGRQVIGRALTEGNIRSTVATWAAQTPGYDVDSITIKPDKIVVTVVGPTGVDPPSAAGLAKRLSSKTGEVQVVVRVLHADVQTTVTR